jgi:hypothetical protein
MIYDTLDNRGERSEPPSEGRRPERPSVHPRELGIYDIYDILQYMIYMKTRYIWFSKTSKKKTPLIIVNYKNNKRNKTR